MVGNNEGQSTRQQEAEFVELLTMFNAGERASLLELLRNAVKGKNIEEVAKAA